MTTQTPFSSNLITKEPILTYGQRGVDAWWKQNREILQGKTNLTVLQLPQETTKALSVMVERTLDLSCNIEDGQLMMMGKTGTVIVEPIVLQEAH